MGQRTPPYKVVGDPEKLLKALLTEAHLESAQHEYFTFIRANQSAYDLRSCHRESRLLLLLIIILTD
jgi:hypothetical protein